ncbi:hypothetical protein [Peribacillus sp. AS_2]|uniref:hypothetical protein n=1 Tax=Peribacillus sp. AS_2 TaxID=2996755 RepID=UPI0022A799F1|nr:hypothetical protein [Peribacillus sp. AS_2]MCZ0871041.1 hypothetical protein [Peribacillus sp. AS_2]
MNQKYHFFIPSFQGHTKNILVRKLNYAHVSGYITISLLVPVLILFIFLSHQEWSLAQSPYHVLDERIPVESKELAQNSYMKAANGKVISEISTGEKRT